LEEINLVFGERVAVRMDDITEQEAHKEVGGMESVSDLGNDSGKSSAKVEYS
jgi:hypothetical protein